MLGFLTRRIATGFGLLLIVLTAVFFVVRAVPGDPAQLLASGGASGQATEEAVAQTRSLLGLDRPLWEQFLHFLSGFFTGDLGVSFADGRPVTAAVLDRLPNSLELVLAAAVIGVVVGAALGVLAALRGGVVDTIVTALTSLAVAVPVYVLGVVLAYVFAVTFQLLPAGGFVSWNFPVRHLRQLVLPAVALAVPFSAVVARMTRAGILDTRRQDWVRTARSWGMAPRPVFVSHVFRNALTPVVTAVGLEIGLMLGSTVLIERVFSFPGLSQLLIEAVEYRDYPMVQGVVLLVAVLFIGLNIVVDALYGVLDPRARR